MTDDPVFRTQQRLGSRHELRATAPPILSIASLAQWSWWRSRPSATWRASRGRAETRSVSARELEHQAGRGLLVGCSYESRRAFGSVLGTKATARLWVPCASWRSLHLFVRVHVHVVTVYLNSYSIESARSGPTEIETEPVELLAMPTLEHLRGTAAEITMTEVRVNR